MNFYATLLITKQKIVRKISLWRNCLSTAFFILEGFRLIMIFSRHMWRAVVKGEILSIIKWWLCWMIYHLIIIIDLLIHKGMLSVKIIFFNFSSETTTSLYNKQFRALFKMENCTEFKRHMVVVTKNVWDWWREERRTKVLG